MEPTYEDYEKRAMPTGIILTQHSWDKLSPQGRVNLLAVLPTLEQRAELEQLTAEATLRSRAEQAEAQLVPGSPTERYPTVWAYEQACAALATTKTQLAAAEARATEAAAEAGKWQQRHGELLQELAEQEVQTLALIEVLATASAKEFLDNAEIKEMVEDPRVAGRWTLFRRGMEQGANELARKALGMKAAPAPLAPQQQEGGGVPSYEEFCAIARAGGFISLPTRSTWDRLTEQGKCDMMPIAAFRPSSL